MPSSTRQAGFALAAAIAFLCVAVLNLVSYALRHEQFQLWGAGGFAAVSLLWFLVFTRRKQGTPGVK